MWCMIGHVTNTLEFGPIETCVVLRVAVYRATNISTCERSVKPSEVALEYMADSAVCSIPHKVVKVISSE